MISRPVTLPRFLKSVQLHRVKIDNNIKCIDVSLRTIDAIGMYGELDLLKYFAHIGVNLGKSIPFQVSKYGQIQIIAWYLEKNGGYCNSLDKRDFGAVTSSSANITDICKVLFGDNCLRITKDILYFTMYFKFFETAKYLYEYCDTEYLNTKSARAIINSGNLSLVKYIASVIPDAFSSLELHYSIIWGYHDIYLFLLRIGILPSQNCINLAIQSKKLNTLKFLIKRGCTPDETTFDLAVSNFNTDIIKCLAKHFEFKISNEFLHHLAASCYLEIFKSLHEYFNLPLTSKLAYTAEMNDNMLVAKYIKSHL